MSPSSPIRRPVRVLTTRGLLQVRVCRLYGALVPRDAGAQHDRHHHTSAATIGEVTA